MSKDPDIKQKFTGYWIPVELENLGLNRNEQFLLSMIDSLDAGSPEHCYATNSYLAKKLNLSESRVSYYITKLKRMKLIEEVGYDGRRRRIKSLKQNWYENSKKELCVKTRSQTTRKQEVRLRENAHHISKIDKEKYIKESKHPAVHKSPSDSIIPPSASAAQGSIPFHRKDSKQEISLNDPVVLEILDMEADYIKYFRPDIVVRWIKKFGPKKVLDTIRFFFQIKSTQKKPIPKPEAWMESAFKKSYAEVDKTCQENKQFAEKLKKNYGLATLKINKRYCQDTKTGRDYYYYLPPGVFRQALQQLCES